MAKLIYVKSSPRKERSHSSRVAEEFVSSYREAHPEDVIKEIDPWSLDLPPFDGPSIDAKYAIMHSRTQSPEQIEVWNRVINLFREFSGGDKYLFSVPMWNFGIPYRLKHYIDIITQPGLAFSVSPEGSYTGLIAGKPAVVVYSSGGSYRPNTGAEGFDLQKPYMKLWLQFIGFTAIQEITVDSTLGDPKKAKEIEASCLQKAKEVGKTF